MTYVCWATVDGGDDLTGTREEMEARAAEWRAEGLPGMQYEVVPYDND